MPFEQDGLRFETIFNESGTRLGQRATVPGKRGECVVYYDVNYIGIEKIDEAGIDLRDRDQVEEWAETNYPKSAENIMIKYDAAYGVSEFLIAIRSTYPHMASK